MKKSLYALIFALCAALSGCGKSSDITDSNSQMVTIEEYNRIIDERDYYKEMYETLANQTKESNPIEDISSEASSDTLPKSTESKPARSVPAATSFPWSTPIWPMR